MTPRPALPRTLRFFFHALLALLLLQSLLRLVWFFALRSPADSWGAPTLWAFWLGLRFDLRLALLLLLPWLLLAPMRWCSPDKVLARRLWQGYFVFVAFWLFLFFAVDFGHMAYLRERLNARLLQLLQDPREAAGMVWSSYPVGAITLALLVWLTLAWHSTGALMQRIWRTGIIVRGAVATFTRRARLAWVLLSVPLVALGIHSRLGQYPLRWSDAFAAPDTFTAALALNPALMFFETMDLRGKRVDMQQVRAAYAPIAAYLGVSAPDAQNLNLLRRSSGHEAEWILKNGHPRNLVIVIVESFSAYKTGVFGNRLNPTPHFDELARSGVLFTRHFTAHGGTARGVFSTLASVPDVELARTASRNPRAVEQATLLQALGAHDKFYFIGGSLAWANIRALVAHNVPGIELYEEGRYHSPRNDVWGISDKNLFLEAIEHFSATHQAGRPFAAIIQTSGNHRPYAIPAEDLGDESQGAFARHTLDAQTLQRQGFEDNDQYNAFRFSDWCIGRFMREAQKQSWFGETLFVFLGDHGIIGNTQPQLPKAFSGGALELSQGHTPLLFYAPQYLPARKLESLAMQIDVLPSAVSLLGVSVQNQSLGRDVFDRRFDGNRGAFLIFHSRGPEIGWITRTSAGERYLRLGIGSGQASWHDILAPDPLTDISAREPQQAKNAKAFVQDFYTMAQYRIEHNAPASSTHALTTPPAPRREH